MYLVWENIYIKFIEIIYKIKKLILVFIFKKITSIIVGIFYENIKNRIEHKIVLETPYYKFEKNFIIYSL